MGASYPKPKLQVIFRVLNTTIEGEVEKWEVLGWVKNDSAFQKIKYIDLTKELLRRLDMAEGRTMNKKTLQSLFTGWFEEDVDVVIANLLENGREAVRGQQNDMSSTQKGDRFSKYRVLKTLWNKLDRKKSGLVNGELIGDVLKPSQFGHNGFLLKSRLDNLHHRIDFSKFSEFFQNWTPVDIQALTAIIPSPEGENKKITTLHEAVKATSKAVLVRPPLKAWDMFEQHKQMEKTIKLKTTNSITKQTWEKINQTKDAKRQQMLNYKQRQREAQVHMEVELRREMMLKKVAERDEIEVNIKKTAKREQLIAMTKQTRDRNREEQCTDNMRMAYQQALRLVMLGPVTPQEELMLEKLRETHHISDTTHEELYSELLRQQQSGQ